MVHKFGIFDTVEDLNRAAAAQKAEGDLEALVSLAEENDIDREDAEDYYYSGEPGSCLCTPGMAAAGRLEREAEKLHLQSELKDWKDYILQLVVEEEPLARAVFEKKDKSLLEVLAAGLKRASNHRIRVSDAIIKAAGLPESAAYMGMCGRDELWHIVLDYYLGEAEK